MNSLDVQPALAAAEALSLEDVLHITRKHGLIRGKTAAFLGGMDASKRIDFLRIALDVIWTMDPEFRLIVAGRGEDERLLDTAADRGQVVRLGFGETPEKALIARCAQSIAMPGRIGLVAVESIALGLPIVTTPYAFHAPESEYLIEGESRFTSSNTPIDYAKTLINVTRRYHPRTEYTYPTLDQMVANFRRGILAMMSRGE